MAPVGEKKPLLNKKGDEETQDNIAVDHSQDIPSLKDEAWDILRLGVPIFIARLSWVGMKTTDTALLGHVSGKALSAAALSDLWTMCTMVLLTGQVLGVFIGGAVGAGNPKLAGIYLQVSLVVLGSMSLIVFTAWNLTEQVWVAFGSDPEIAAMAGYYARVLSFAIPGILIFGQVSQFFSAQRIMNPEVNSASFGLLMNLVLGLIFVLGWPIKGFGGYGFEACPIVTASVTYFQLALLLIVYVKIQRLHETCWGGWNWAEITKVRIVAFCELYVPAALAFASDFWRTGVIGAVAAKLGEQEVAVFNTSYRIMWIALVLVGALSGASAINMSLRLGGMNPKGAKQAGYVGIVMATSVLLLLSMAILFDSRLFGMIFTQDEEFLDMFEEASVPFTITLFCMNLAVALERIPYSMGRTREVFAMGFVGSWVGQVPAVFICTTYWRDDLVGLYTGMAIGYFMLVILYGIIVYRSDWARYAELAQERSEATVKAVVF
eukprot:CAMPEP_0113634170 /NCGR_PEP_ID=MMETSP0017_2-20120614/17790_1 /TAXON_ID=2856 /ORGANISM="Cylindrotheca closterium" /LENGTH=491 /DNA_ID=CAMNT_0000544853 /DNA_START=49 /DNA_END=1524 /DNA_ORIENTATION=- /assembly_acc=CAM_ASM_000147